MKIDITGRNTELTPGLRRHIQERLEHTAALVKDFVDAHVTLTTEKQRHIAEVVVRRKRRGSLVGEAATRDMHRSIQEAIERVQSQLTRKHDKQVSRRRRGASLRDSAEIELTPPVAADADDDSPPALIEEKMDRVKPITLDEAVMLLDTAKRPFVMFRSAETDRLVVIYRRKDGRVGVVAPRT